MNSNFFSNPDWRNVQLPGLTAQTIAANRIRGVNAEEAELLCGAAQGGTWIPYHDIEGAPLLDDGAPFGRLRLADPDDDRKYHSKAGTRSHLFMPVALRERLSHMADGTLFATEGEKKGISLVEYGLPAVGFSGIWNATPSGKLVPELTRILRDWPIERLVWVADSDAGIMADFSRAMVRLATLLPSDVSLTLIVPGLVAPAKGIDDLRAKLGEGFAAYWATLNANRRVEVARGITWEALALDLLKRESRAEIAKLVNGSAEQEAA